MHNTSNRFSNKILFSIIIPFILLLVTGKLNFVFSYFSSYKVTIGDYEYTFPYNQKPEDAYYAIAIKKNSNNTAIVISKTRAKISFKTEEINELKKMFNAEFEEKTIYNTRVLLFKYVDKDNFKLINIHIETPSKEFITAIIRNDTIYDYKTVNDIVKIIKTEKKIK